MKNCIKININMQARKDIKLLSTEEAKTIFEYVFPPNIEKYKYYSFSNISFEPIMTENGQQVSMGLRPLVGINYHNGQDRCILHFDNTKVVRWLYENDYEIKELLENNQHLSEMENDFENFSFAIHWLAQCLEKRDPIIEERTKFEYTFEYIIKTLREHNEKYYYKDYN